MTTPIPLNNYQQYATYCVLFLLALITYTAFQEHSIFLDCDSPWHIAAGDHIRSLGNIPATDPWSFTAGDTKWYNLSWLYDVFVSYLHQLSGIQGLVAINLLIAAAIPCLLAKLCFTRGCSITSTLIACILGLIMLKACISIRPQQMSLIPAALALLLCYQYRQKITPLIWLLPIIATFWANIHGSYLVLFSIIGSFFLEALFNKDQQRVKTYILVGISCVLTMMINPLGYEIFYGSWLSLGGTSQEYITEWQPAKLSKTPQIYIYLLLMITLPFAARIKLPMADIILVAFWMMMAMNSARHNVILVIFITPILAILFTEIFSRKTSRIQRAEVTMQRDFSQPNMVRQFIAIIGIAVLLYIIPISRNVIISDNLYDPGTYPVEEINYLKTNHPDSHIFNTYCYGGYLIYQGEGTLKPLLDSRADTVFRGQLQQDYFDMLYFTPSWQRIADNYPIHFAIFPNDDDTAKQAFQHANWPVIYQGPVATIYKNAPSQ